MSAVLRLVEEPPARPTTAEALEAVLADDDRLWETFEGACQARGSRSFGTRYSGSGRR